MERPRQPRTIAKPPRLRGKPARPYGPLIARQKEVFVTGPGEPPTGFIGGQNSVTEWIVYWALAKVFDNPHDPRQPPYFGGYPDWEYQSPQLGIFTRAMGSAVVDFLVYLGGTLVAIRLQTEYFHLFTSSKKHAADLQQKALLSRSLNVIDLYDQDVLGDPTGAKAVVAVKNALNMIERPDVVNTKTAIRASRIRIGR